jgi:putative ABC transport system substrate-binding protein
VKRREFITLVGGAAAAWPLAARAQQTNRMRRVGILMPFSESDTAAQARVRAFKEELRRLGWIEDSQIHFDVRWTTDNMDLVRVNAASLLELKSEVIVAAGDRVIPILKQMTSEVPIIIAASTDPVGAGLVASLAHPGGNITGFSTFEHSIIGKQLGLLKQIAPNVSRIALIYNPDNPSTAFFERSFRAAAPLLNVEPIVTPIHGITDSERAIQAIAATQNGGIIFPPDITLLALREQIVAIVARSRVPTIYSDAVFTRTGGLASYSANRVELSRRAASYVDRVLRGEKPSDLPVQLPDKYELVINLKTAKALGIEVPPGVLSIADEVIE